MASLCYDADKPTVQSVPDGFNVVATLYGSHFDCADCNVTVVPQATSVGGLGGMNKRYANLIVQKYRQHAHAISTDPQFRPEIDDILDGLRKEGVREQ